MIFRWPFSRQPVASAALRAIFIADSAGKAMHAVTRIRAIAGSGLQDDRYSKATGFWKATDACQVTLISEDDLQQARKRLPAGAQYVLESGGHRRNLVISGIKTSALENKTFRIGSAIFRYHKPRPPCAYLDKVQGAGLGRALGKHSGVCLYVISEGALAVGDSLEIVSKDKD
jgi:MOSC domain